MKQKFIITETYSKAVEIDAADEYEAYDKLDEMMCSGEIRMTSEDFDEWNIYPLNDTIQ